MSNDDIRARLDSQSDAIGVISDRLLKLDEGLRGNGGPGLFTEFAIVKERLSNVEGYFKDVKGIRRLLAGGVIAAVGSFACAAAVWVMKMQ